ncbi:hypothetical protein O7635_24945 [Asanoa sp. WMMD1127]|uniref:hypothetical protein n=1 Tax=Asanoa sp. WMMD1127 TaxID=3016107 RepID=UPI0024159CEC|nr:hypothetical protein [Asanoa sp. WMMD1127]MDG4825108.1 hypothetical protein [Asanoa sp. WMMD1127]
MRSRVVSRSADVVLVTVRELRLLLGLLLILFLTAETWRFVGQLTTLRLLVFIALTFAAAFLVVGVGLRRVLRRSIARRAAVRVGLEILAFATAIFVTFATAGVASVDAELVTEWSGSQGGVLVSLGIGRPPLVITRQLLQVAAFLAALGALVFAIEVIADEDTRHTLTHDLAGPPD